ncbi:MAG: hypothetical protein KBT11_02960 [Treponema sp.]|nr:hypothetical protein [Candidatus Treponema equifaecale]
MKIVNIKTIFGIGIALAVGATAFAQNGIFNSQEAKSRSAAGARSAASGLGEEEFRRGVQAYYKGSFNDAILQFEKALSYLPGENVILDWLGKAYYRTGAEGTALQNWQYASEAGYGGILLNNRIEIVRERRLTAGEGLSKPVKYTESGVYSGKNSEGILVFSQPVSLLPNNDGTLWLLSYGSNELIKMDQNGLVLDRSFGSMSGFDRPMDLLRTSDGSMLVSEFAGDRISLFTSKGKFVKSFGQKGVGIGCVVGPQYLAEDSDGNIYVSDFGNSRVDVFDKEGNGLFFFGGKQGDFAGLEGPTGIAVYGNIVYVADCLTGAIQKFDTAGNYLGLLCKKKTFSKPESMKIWGRYLVVCDKNRVYSVDSDTGAVFENVSSGNAPSKLTCAVPDINGNILVTDFTSNEIYVMAKMSELVGGLFVQIEKVNADNFPHVTVEVKIENRSRQSVVGLKENNFLITENKAAVSNYKLEGATYVNDEADITLLIDRSRASAEYDEAMENAVKELAAAMKGKGILRIVSAGSVPLLEYEGSPANLTKFSARSLKNPVSANISMDLALRLCANALINESRKSCILLIGNGQVTQGAFARYGLADLTTYLNNNSISFVSLLLNQGSACSEIDYLQKNTEGGQYYVYRDKGLAQVIEDIIDIPSGIYVLSYNSALTTNFGQKYLPIEVETYLMNRSGRDESGYFAPLQ